MFPLLLAASPVVLLATKEVQQGLISSKMLMGLIVHQLICYSEMNEYAYVQVLIDHMNMYRINFGARLLPWYFDSRILYTYLTETIPTGMTDDFLHRSPAMRDVTVWPRSMAFQP